MNLKANFINFLYNDNNQNNNILSNIKENSLITKEDAISIYKNNLFSSLRDALIIEYDILRKIINNDDIFMKLVKLYISDNISISENLDDYGRDFYKLFSNNYYAKKIINSSFYRDIAILISYMSKSYIAKDNKKINITKLQSILNDSSNNNISLKLNDSLFLISSYYDLSNYSNLNIISPYKNRKYFIIYRNIKNNDIYSDIIIDEITRIEFLFLSLIKNNIKLYDIYNIFDIDLEKILPKFIVNNVIVDIFNNNIISVS